MITPIKNAGEQPEFCFVHSWLSARFWWWGTTGFDQEDDYDDEDDDDGDEDSYNDDDHNIIMITSNNDDNYHDNGIGTYDAPVQIFLQAFKLEVVEVDGNTSQVKSHWKKAWSFFLKICKRQKPFMIICED